MSIKCKLLFSKNKFLDKKARLQMQPHFELYQDKSLNPTINSCLIGFLPSLAR
jgi:hypothetical protein